MPDMLDPERPWIRDADNAWPLANPHQVNAIRRISITRERKVGYLGTHRRAIGER